MDKMLLDLDDLQNWVLKKKFNTRGLPLTKKLWRDGYNKAIDDFLTFLESDQAGKS